MAGKPLNFEPISSVGSGTELSGSESAVERWKSREPNHNPTVQMSVRMPAVEYDAFRALCKRERRTNGDMLAVLVKAYLKHEG